MVTVCQLHRIFLASSTWFLVAPIQLTVNDLVAEEWSTVAVTAVFTALRHDRRLSADSIRLGVDMNRDLIMPTNQGRVF